MSHVERRKELPGADWLLCVMRVMKRPIRVRLTSHSEADLARLDDRDLEIGNWARDRSRRVRLVCLTCISHNKAGVAVGLGLEPNQLVAVTQPLRAAGAGVVGDQSRPASGDIQNTDLVRFGMRFERVGCLSVDGKGA